MDENTPLSKEIAKNIPKIKQIEKSNSLPVCCRSTCARGSCCGDCYDKLSQAIEKTTELIQLAISSFEKQAGSLRSNKSNEDEEIFLLTKAKRPDKVVVEIKSAFLQIVDIDTLNQNFGAEIFIQAKWEEPKLQTSTLADFKRIIDSNELDKFIPWEPQLKIVNLEGQFTTNKKTFDVKFHEPGYEFPVVLQLWRFKGVFMETLELQSFPFDVQDLTISISTERSSEEVDLVEDQRTLSSINTNAFMDGQEWDVYEHVETRKDVTTVEYCSAVVHPILHVQCRVARQVGYFVTNVVFIVILLFCTSFTTFTIDADSPDRLISTITLFLTAVAFKLVVQQSLPTISYLTYLDIYIVASLIYLTIQAGQNALIAEISRGGDVHYTRYMDRYTILAMAILFVVAHVIFTVFIYRTASRRRRDMKYKDSEYQDKKAFLKDFGRLPKPGEGRQDAVLKKRNKKLPLVY